MGAELELLVLGGLGAHQDVADRRLDAGATLPGVLLQELDVGFDDRVGVVVDLRALHVAALVFQVELADHVLVSQVDVDGLVVQVHLGRRLVHLADHLVAALGGVHDHDVARSGAAQGDLLRRVGSVGPEPAAPAETHHSVLLQVVQELPVAAGQGLVFLERQLEHRALELIVEDEDVLRVNPAGLRRAAEEVLRVADQVLVHRRGGGHQHRQADRRAPPGTAGLLPGRGDRAGKAGQDRDVQPADVDAQFQGVGGHDPQNLPLPQAPLDGTPLVGQVPAPVGGHLDPAVLGVQVLQGFTDVGGDELGAQARAGEHDGLDALFEQPRGDPRGFLDDPFADPLDRVHEGRIVQHEVPRPRRSAVVVEEHDGLLDDPLGQLPGIADGGGTADKPGPGAVERRHPLEAADQVGHMRAEHPAVGVDLVDDHEAEGLEELDPLGMVGQHPGVKHVGIGDHQPPLFAHRDPDRLGGVSVVGEDLEGQPGGDQHLVELRLLVLGQGLGRKKVHGLGIRFVQEALQDREVVRQGLAGGRRSHDHNVVSPAHLVVGRPLVSEQPLDSAAGQGLPNAGIDLRRKLRVAALPGRDLLPVGHAAHEGRVVAQGFDRPFYHPLASHHRSIIALGRRDTQRPHRVRASGAGCVFLDGSPGRY